MRPNKKWILAAIVLLPLLALLLGAYPFFAVNAPVKSDVLVVEGWLKPEQLDSVARLVERAGYERVYTTGVVRPCSYHLKAGEAVEAVLRKPVSGSGSVWLAGLPGETAAVILDTDTVLKVKVTGDVAEHRFDRITEARVVRVVCITASGDTTGSARVYLGGLDLDSTGLHQLARDLFVIDRDGRATAMGTTWAHSAAMHLVHAGLPSDRVTPKPTYGDPARNTWTTASDFVEFAENEGIRSFNVATLGVHARRTRGLYRRAAGGSIVVGVHSVYDRWCRREDWWSHWYGWWKVLKEVAGAHQPYTAG